MAGPGFHQVAPQFPAFPQAPLEGLPVSFDFRRRQEVPNFRNAALPHDAGHIHQTQFRALAAGQDLPQFAHGQRFRPEEIGPAVWITEVGDKGSGHCWCFAPTCRNSLRGCSNGSCPLPFGHWSSGPVLCEGMTGRTSGDSLRSANKSPETSRSCKPGRCLGSIFGPQGMAVLRKMDELARIGVPRRFGGSLATAGTHRSCAGPRRSSSPRLGK